MVLSDILSGLLNLQDISYLPLVTHTTGALARAAAPSGHRLPSENIATRGAKTYLAAPRWGARRLMTPPAGLFGEEKLELEA